jgi:hypothetical protein
MPMPLSKSLSGPKDSTLLPRFAENYGNIQVHKFFRKIADPVHFLIHSLSDRSTVFDVGEGGTSTFSDIEFSSMTSYKDFGPNQIFEGQLASSMKEEETCYLRPLSHNFATFNFFLYQRSVVRPGYQPLISAQVTDTPEHPLATVANVAQAHDS